ncbi:MAG: potassium channel protein [Blastocatellia bacterium]|nr:potassium channel protein [Blastocatellia bacterium]MBK6428013.1 potassium channel protein [Blastocatellia bacterium]
MAIVDRDPYQSTPRRRVVVAIYLVAGLLAAGTIGFRLVEGWPWFTCLYFSVITLATIGFNEPAGMTDSGRAFTIVLVLGGVGTLGYSLTLLVQVLIQGELLETREKRRMQKRLENLKDHFIICGAGRVGSLVGHGLVGEGADFVVVEREREVAETITAEGWVVLLGDATREDVLERAGIDRARGLVCALPTDSDNVYTALTARDLAPDLMIVARANEESTMPKLRKAGANKVISPLRTGAQQIVQALTQPSVLQFLELATGDDALDLGLEEVAVQSGSTIDGTSLRDSGIRSRFDVIIVAIVRPGGDMLFNPTAETRVSGGDKIVAVGRRAGLDGLAELSLPEGTAGK